jgi:PAS domain S-box-containing protein
MRVSPVEYERIVEQAPIMIWRSGLNAECDYFNEGWLDFTGRKMEEEVGNGWADGVHPDDLQRCLNIYQTAFHNREIFEMEYRLRRRDGMYRWVFDRGVPFRDSDGEFAGYVGSAIDITERIDAQEALRKAEEAELNRLRGMLPICSSCKSIRDDRGHWSQIETYISERSEASFTHGLCPSCARKLYPELYRKDQ